MRKIIDVKKVRIDRIEIWNKIGNKTDIKNKSLKK